MKKFSKLVAVSAAAMTFGITGVSALNNTNVVNADSLTADNGKLTNDINGMKAENSPLHEEINTDFGCLVEGINKTASQLQPNESLKNIKQDLNNNTYELGEGDNYKAGDQNSDWGTLRDTWQRCDTVKDNTAAEQAYEGVYNDANQVLADKVVNLLLQTLTSKQLITTTSKTRITVTMRMHKATHQTRKLM